MYAGPDRRGFAFFLDVVAAIPDEGPSMAIGHHVAAIGTANRDGHTVMIEGPRFAGDVAVTDEGAQVLGGSPSRRPVVGTRLVRLGRVDSPKPIRRAIDLEHIAINHAVPAGADRTRAPVGSSPCIVAATVFEFSTVDFGKCA
jgi:hypothetical protein